MTSNGLLQTPSVEVAGMQERTEAWKQYQKNGRTTQCRLRDQISALTFSQQDFPVSQSVRQDAEKAQKMTAGSGLRCLRRFMNLSHTGSSWKTCLVSSLLKQDWYSSNVALTWKLKGTKFNRCLFQLAVSMPRIGGNGFGLSQAHLAARGTVGKTNRLGERKNELLLIFQIALLPTPKSTVSGPDNNRRNRKRSGGCDLFTLISMLPIPTGMDNKSEKCRLETCEENARPLSKTIGTNIGMKLQPAFVEWMMGYPIWWTACEHSGTASSPKWRPE